MASQLAPCLRSELGVPIVVFGGVLLISTAFCGAIDAMNPNSKAFVDEVQVVQAENVIATPDADLLATCKKAKKGFAHGDVQCDKNRFQSASLH